VKSILTIAEEIYRQKLNDLIDEYRGGQLIQYMSQLQIKGVVDYCAVIPHGNYLDVTNAIRCTEVIVSNDIEADVAIMRLQQNYLPIGATYVPLKKIVDKKLKLGETIYTSGFPYDVVSTSKLDKQQIHVNAVEGQITKNDDICAFLTTAPIAGGASGSPVFNEYGELVGVMHAQIKNKQSYNFGI
jgi:S1-C subfamily serine protease